MYNDFGENTHKDRTLLVLIRQGLALVRRNDEARVVVGSRQTHHHLDKGQALGPLSHSLVHE